MAEMAGLIAQIVVFGLLSPGIAVSAFLAGWIARRWWLVPVAAVVIAAVFATISMVNLDAPADSEIVWAAVPFTIVAPLVWCSAGFYFGRWRRSRHVKSGSPGAARVASILAGVVTGAAIGTLAGLGLGEAYVTLARVSSFEGLAGYVVVFLFMLPGLLIGAAAGGAVGGIVQRRFAARRLGSG
jgi:hypothetical protein